MASDLINKLSSYNLFNYLLPGILFCLVVSYFTSLNLLVDDLLVAAFFYYFCGMVISRVGSLVVEPIYKRLNFIQYANYRDYLKATEIDERIEVLTEANNTYRTFVSLFCMVGVAKLYDYLVMNFVFFNKFGFTFVVVILFVLFSFSFSKQTSYIRSRVEKHSN